MTKNNIVYETMKYFYKFRIIEELGYVTFQIPGSLDDQLEFGYRISHLRPAGIVFLYRPLPWYRCWFKKQQFISKL